MSALDQAFIKAYKQQNPALAPAGLEAVKKAYKQPNSVSAPAALETANAVPLSEAVKDRPKPKVKTSGKSGGERIVESHEPPTATRTSATKTSESSRKATSSGTNLSSSKRSKSVTKSPACNPPHATKAKAAKKPKPKSVEDSSPPTVAGLGVPDIIYRLDQPLKTSVQGASAGVQPVMAAPHANTIFSEFKSVLPQGEPILNQGKLSVAEANTPRSSKNSSGPEMKPSKSSVGRKADSPKEKTPVAAKPTAATVTSENWIPQAFAEGWTKDITRAMSKFDATLPNSDTDEIVPEPTKVPVDFFGSLSVGLARRSVSNMEENASILETNSVKQYAASQVPSSEKRAVVEKDITREKIDTVDNTPPPEKPTVADAPPVMSIRLFQPMLQVEHFAWPKVCSRLETDADVELEGIAETLLAANIRGKKVFALGGCHQGDGATSLLLATGKRLAAQGLKVVMVEADWGQPQLARRLGLLPQYGWEDVLAGRLPLEEVLIESIAERLVILPVREPFTTYDLPSEASSRMAETWESLRHHFDVVLVDPGPLSSTLILDKQFAGVLASRIEATVMVKNLRQQDTGEFDAVSQALSNAGAKVIGIVENFLG